jgi:hypothetical protein
VYVKLISYLKMPSVDDSLVMYIDKTLGFRPRINGSDLSSSFLDGRRYVVAFGKASKVVGAP